MSTPHSSEIDLRQQALQRLQALQRAGVTAFPRPIAPPARQLPNSDTTATPPTETCAADSGGTTATTADPAQQLQVLNDQVCQCTRCDQLVQNRTQTVFGVGNVRPRLCFFGEGPGADEDRQGEPFVGAAGQLLNKIIAAMGLSREEVYILNVVKCRPPGNRTPTTEEAENCRPFFEKQLEILDPEYICCLGKCAAQTLLRNELSLAKMRGQVHSYRNAKVVVTYHPAYLLRRPEEKSKTWADVQIIMRALGLSK